MALNRILPLYTTIIVMFKVVYVSSSESALSFQTLTFITAAGNRKLGLYFLISSSTTQKVKHLIHNGNYKRKLKEMIHSERNLSDDVKILHLMCTTLIPPDNWLRSKFYRFVISWTHIMAVTRLCNVSILHDIETNLP